VYTAAHGRTNIWFGNLLTQYFQIVSSQMNEKKFVDAIFPNSSKSNESKEVIIKNSKKHWDA
jgi:hypothetical protein